MLRGIQSLPSGDYILGEVSTGSSADSERGGFREAKKKAGALCPGARRAQLESDTLDWNGPIWHCWRLVH